MFNTFASVNFVVCHLYKFNGPRQQLDIGCHCKRSSQRFSSLTDPSHYDDLSTLPAKGIALPVGVHDKTSHENVASLSDADGSATGFIPHSNPNVAFAKLAGLRLLATTGQYSRSKKKSISPVSVYYGCTVGMIATSLTQTSLP